VEKVRLLRQILGSTPYTPTNIGDLSHDMVTQVYQTFSAIAFSTEIKRWLKEWSFNLLSYYSLFNIPLKTNLAYAWRSRPLSREGSLSCHICCDQGTRFFPVLLDEPPHSVASYDTQREMENLFKPGSSRISCDPFGSITLNKSWSLHKNIHGTGYFDINTSNHCESGTILQRYDANKELRVWDQKWPPSFCRS
jgi:hypothetical protein